jgi:hypothetical protein
MTSGCRLQKAKGRLELISLGFQTIIERRCGSGCGKIFSATVPTDRSR